jgi:hypothetical protein
LIERARTLAEKDVSKLSAQELADHEAAVFQLMYDVLSWKITDAGSPGGGAPLLTKGSVSDVLSHLDLDQRLSLLNPGPNAPPSVESTEHARHTKLWNGLKSDQEFVQEQLATLNTDAASLSPEHAPAVLSALQRMVSATAQLEGRRFVLSRPSVGSGGSDTTPYQKSADSSWNLMALLRQELDTWYGQLKTEAAETLRLVNAGLAESKKPVASRAN